MCSQFFHHSPPWDWHPSKKHYVNCKNPIIRQLLRPCHLFETLEYTPSLMLPNTHFQADSFDLHYSSQRTGKLFSLFCVPLFRFFFFFFRDMVFSALHMHTWGKRPYHRVGINELCSLCSASAGSYLEALQVGRISGEQRGRGKAIIYYLFPHLTLAVGSSPTFICSKGIGVGLIL